MDFLRDRRVDEWEKENRLDDLKAIEARVRLFTHPARLFLGRLLPSRACLRFTERKTNILLHPRSVKKKQKKRVCRRVRLHRPFLAEEALACQSSLRWHLDSEKFRA
jgi:hypothetical protein